MHLVPWGGKGTQFSLVVSHIRLKNTGILLQNCIHFPYMCVRNTPVDRYGRLRVAYRRTVFLYPKHRQQKQQEP